MFFIWSFRYCIATFAIRQRTTCPSQRVTEKQKMKKYNNMKTETVVTFPSRFVRCASICWKILQSLYATAVIVDLTFTRPPKLQSVVTRQDPNKNSTYCSMCLGCLFCFVAKFGYPRLLYTRTPLGEAIIYRAAVLCVSSATVGMRTGLFPLDLLSAGVW